MNKLNSLSFLFLLSILTFTTSCKKDKKSGLANLTKAPLGEIIEEPIEISSDSETDSSETASSGITTVCSETTYRWAPGQSAPLLLNQSTDVIYPGAMIGSGSIASGAYAAIRGERAPVTLSVSLSNLAGNPSIESPSGSLSDVRNSLNTLLNQTLTGSAGAEATNNVYEVYSYDHLVAKLGAHGSFGWGSIEGAFDFSSTSETRKFVAEFTQIYYSVDIDIPAYPEDYWTTMPDEAIFNGYVPTVVSSMKYGRVILFMMEYHKDSISSNFSIAANFTGGGFTSSGGYDFENRMTSKKLLVIGGNSGAVAIDSPEDLNNAIEQYAEFGPDNPGKPLSYKLMFINDQTTANVVTSSEYTVRNCVAYDDNNVQTISLDPINQRMCAKKDGGADDDIHSASSTMNYNLTVELSISDDEKSIDLEVYYSASETSRNLAAGSVTTLFPRHYTAPDGYRIAAINSSDNQQIVGTNNNENVIQIPQTASGDTEPGIIDYARIRTNGSSGYNDFWEPGDACNSSKVSVEKIVFNDIAITLLPE